jgi:hypothetical protein
MKAAIVQGRGQMPVYGDFSEPMALEGESLVSVTAAAISHVVKSRASGAHYSSSGGFPVVVGIDGVRRLEDGRRVYFVLPKDAVDATIDLPCTNDIKRTMYGMPPSISRG